MKKVFILIFIGGLLLCCSDKKSSIGLETSIDLEKETLVSISDLFESIDVVQLETNEQCLIQLIWNVIFYNNRYYIFDVRQQTLLCFDLSGKFLFKINRKGQGPGEYVYIEQFNMGAFQIVAKTYYLCIITNTANYDKRRICIPCRQPV